MNYCSERTLQVSLTGAVQMCSQKIESGWQEVTPLRQVQLQKQKEGQSAELINLEAYVIQALSSLCQTLLITFYWEM